ncbi:MAG: CDP-alcohol phosphatidyltransferase family protein, partial [bacterium]|nr:CDP-alcohol phosphatidyltransferase family protein [bacterium]
RLVSLVREGPIKPDHLTWASFSCGLLGAGVLLASNGQWSTLIAAALLFQAAYIIDCADGQLARIREQYSRHGWRLDLYSDRITETVILISVSAFLAREEPAYWALGMATLGVTTLLQYSRIHELMNAATFSSHDSTGDTAPQESRLREAVDRLEGLRRKYRLGFLNVGNFYFLNFVFLVAGRADLFLWSLLVLGLAATVFHVCKSAIKQADTDAGLAQVSRGGSRAVLFGAGKGAAQFVAGFRNRGVEIAYVCDNDEARWGDSFFGAPIVDPRKIADEAHPVTVFIASEWASQIRPQVHDYGVPEERIISLY